LLAQIDYGRDLDRFLRAQTAFLPHEEEFFTSLAATDILPQILLAIANVVSRVEGIFVAQVFFDGVNALSPIVDGIKVYKLALGVISSKETRFLLDIYAQIRTRPQNNSPQAAWQEITMGGDFDELLRLVSARTRLPMDRLDEWFENAFSAYRLVGYSDSANLRSIAGIAIAEEAAQLQ
ncbi:MAG: hypothetical protein ACRERD_19670, partial [Candidatus Binatia bacterium]